MSSNKRRRVHRVAKALAELPISPDVIQLAFEDFRETGELPQSKAVAKAVIVWADSGVDATRFGDDPLDQQSLLRAYLQQPASERDPLMNQLRQEAVFAPELIRGIACIVLQTLAATGKDPSQPLFTKGEVPTPVMTCPYVALSMVKFPFGLVPEADHPRLEQILERFRGLREQLDRIGNAEERLWFKRLKQAAETFDAGGTVADAMMHEALLAEQELRDLFSSTVREQQGA